MVRTAVALLALSSLASGQPLHLAHQGGAVGQTSALSIAGPAGQPYLLLFDFSEQPTVMNPQVTLDISLFFVPVALKVPGFLGVFPPSGQAAASFVIPGGDPALEASTLSFQAIGGSHAQLHSNLVRVTPALPGTFEATLGAPPLPIAGGAVVPQADGTLLLAGGSGPVAQVYTPALEEFSAAGATFGTGLLAQATPLADGRVLFTGGLGANGQPSAAAAVYDPVAGSTTVLSMQKARAGHGASRLPDGRVLISGGFETFQLTDLLAFLLGIQASSELFDPASGTFVAGPAMLEPRALHTSTALANGRVLVAGGLSVIPVVQVPVVSNTAYEYNPATGSFGLPKFFNGPRLMHSAVALDDGRALLAGGLSLDFSAVLASGDLTQLQVTTLADALVYSGGLFGGFQAGGALSQPRAGAGMAALPGGGALAAGGFTFSLSAGAPPAFQVMTSADRFAANAFAPTGSLKEARWMPLLHPLKDGTVLVVGGGAAGAEVYQP